MAVGMRKSPRKVVILSVTQSNVSFIRDISTRPLRLTMEDL